MLPKWEPAPPGQGVDYLRWLARRILATYQADRLKPDPEEVLNATLYDQGNAKRYEPHRDALRDYINSLLKGD